MEEDLIRASA